MSAQLQVTGEAKIRDIQGPVVANSGVITALDGAASQYVRGDGTLADFPTSSGGGSSVSYYLNSSVSQGTIGGVAYRELSKDPIIGAGTDIAISSNGYVANYITDANDPDVVLVPGGNFNCEFYFSVNNNTGNPTTYAELYKYDGTTFTLLGTSAGVPESINQGTTIAPYYFAIPVATAALSVTDRLAIRIYVNVDSRTVTLHTENGHLCQVVTTLSKGMVSLNNLTDQSQYLATGTSGTNFAIVSSGDTHTFNLPVASATNTGKLSSTDWSTFNGKVPYTGATTNVDLGTNDLTARFIYLNGTSTTGGNLFLRQDIGPAYLLGYTSIYATDENIGFGSSDGTNLKKAIFSFSSLTDNVLRTYTLPDASGTLALTSNLSSYVPYTGATTNVDLGTQTLNASGISSTGQIVADGFLGALGGLVFAKGNTPASFTLGDVILYSESSSNNIVFRDNTSKAKFDFNNSTQTYTFPAATGTIALTSNLSSYLPLTGGTLTGALNGTTATFGGNLNITINTSGDINYLALNDLSWNIGDRKSISWYQSATKLSSIDAYFEAGLNVGFRFSTYLNANFLQDAFTLSSAGAGVFSSTLIANNNISAIRSGSSLTTLGQSRYLNLNDYVGNSNARMEIGFGYSAATGVTNVPAIIGFLTTQASDLGKGDLYFATRDVTTDTAPTVRLTIASSGAATFTGALSGTSGAFSSTLSAMGTNIQFNLDGTFGTNYYTMGFGGVSNGFNRISGGTGTTDGLYITSATGRDIVFRTNGTGSNVLVLASTGAATFSSSVGMGSAPMSSARLTITDGTSIAAYWKATNTNVATRDWTIITNNNNFGDFAIRQGNSQGADATSGTDRLFISSGGNVGIGTSSPTAKVHAVNVGNGFIYRFAGGTSSEITGGIFASTAAGFASIGTTSNHPFNIFTNDTDRLTITSGGNVGIGTSSPASRLTVAAASSGESIRMIGVDTIGDNYFTFFNTAGTRLGYVGYGSSGSDIFDIFNDSSAAMTFSTAATERMRITSSGEVLMHSTTFNSTNAGQFFGTGGDTYFTVDSGIVLYLNRKTTDGVILDFRKNNTTVGTISTNANSLPSDLNFKKNISNLELGLNLVTKLRAVSYNHKIDDDGAALSTGFIAQELEQSLSELGVEQNQYYILQNTPNEDKKQSQYWLDYTKMIPVLVNAIKEQQAQIEELKALIKAK